MTDHDVTSAPLDAPPSPEGTSDQGFQPHAMGPNEDQLPNACQLHVRRVSHAFLERIPRNFAREYLFISQGADEYGRETLLHVPQTPPLVLFNVGTRLGTSLATVPSEDRETIARVIDEAYERHQKMSAGSSASTHLSASDHHDEGEAVESATEDVEALLRTSDEDLLNVAGKAPVVRLVDGVLFEALQTGASDIHVQPLTGDAQVRYRVDGVLHLVHTVSLALATQLVSRIKVMGRMDIAERRVPQDGRAAVRIGSRAIDLRISTMPTSHGERAVIRLLDQSSALCEFAQLGMPDAVAEAFLERADRSNGLILVTGPTGSGKTTTLYSTLRRIITPALNVMTIEDPIEYELSTYGLAISQSQVNRQKGVTFASGLRHILRQDPDVIMIGEIRDLETARIAIQSSLTGHLVFSTLHTNNSAGAVTRLIDLGVEPYLVAASVSAVLAQRLVRTVHDACKGDGCESCLHTGFRGRTGLFELLIVDDELRDGVSSGSSLQAIREMAQRAMVSTLSDAGHWLVEKGRTKLVEVKRVIEMT